MKIIDINFLEDNLVNHPYESNPEYFTKTVMIKSFY